MADGAESWAGQLPEELVRKFAAARKRVRKVVFAKGWTLVVFAACVCFGASIFLDRLLFLRSRYRLALFVACLAAMASFLTMFLIVPLARRISARRIARSVEEKHPELRDLLLSAVELSQQLASGETHTSSELIGAVSQETAGKTRRIDFRSVVPFSAMSRPLLITLAVACALGAYCYFRPMIATNVLQRLLYPYSGPDPLTFTELNVLPGDALVPKGTDVEIKATATGKIPRKAALYLDRKDRRWDKVVLPGDERGEFRYVLKEQLTSLRYRIRAGDARSDTFTIAVADRPVVVGIEVAYRYPEYTGRDPETKSDGGEIVAVKGSEVQITARSNKPLRSARLRFGDGSESLALVRGSVIQAQHFSIKEDDSYSFDLLDTDGFSNAEAIAHRIRAVEDEAPVVGITSPGKYSDARPDEVVPVDFRAVDDFGIHKLWLEYAVTSAVPKEEKDTVPGEERKGVQPIALPERGKTEVEEEYAFSLADLRVKEGEAVVFRVVAEDNNVLSGPGKGSSLEHTIRITSDEALFKRIEEEQQDLSRRLMRLLTQQTENKKLVDQLTEALRGKTSLSEDEMASLGEAKSVQRQIEQTGRQLAGDFSATLEKMRLNKMITPRTLIEMADVTQALEGVSRKEMPEATQTASEAASSKEEKGREKKLTETSVLQKKIIEALSEIRDEFAQLQDEQRMLSLADTARRLAEEQLAAKAQTAAASPELSGLFPEKLTEEQKRRLRKLVEAEEKLREKLAEFEERLRTLHKQLEYANSPDAQLVAAALKYFERGKQPSPASVPQDVEEAIEALRANHLHKSMGLESRVYESLLKLAMEFQKAQMARFQGSFSNTAQGLQLQQPEIDKLIEIQKAIMAETERLPQETVGAAVEGPQLEQFARVSRSQTDLARRTSNFRAILEDVFENLVLIGIDPMTALWGAEEAMGNASVHLEKLKAGAALAKEQDSLENLQKARDELAKALARMMASANLQQSMQGMSALEMMILEQKKVNEGTSQLDEEAGEKKTMTDPMLETLRELVNRQLGLRDRAISMKDYIKMMVKAGEMMEQSARRLNDQHTGQQTQQLQSQILELLMQMLVTLQAQSNAMAQAIGIPGTSGTGAKGGIVTEPIMREVLGGLDDRWADLPPGRKQEMLEKWAEQFSPEFRELIALYFKRLSEEESRR
jgi:hypothetical protein